MKNKNSLLRTRGFTIIEVVIVLAIAALLLIIVLLAVGGLQRSQRTKAAQDAAGRLLTQVIGYESDQGGNTSLAVGFTLPGVISPASGYLGNASLPTSASVSTATAAGLASTGTGNFVYGPGGCDSTNSKVMAAASYNQFALAYYSETGGASVCIHN